MASDYLEQALYDHVFRNTAYTSPANLYLALYTSDPGDTDSGTEVSGGGYARQAITFGAPTDGVGANDTDIEFPQASDVWGDITHIGIRDDVSGGNLIASGAMTTPRSISSGDQINFSIGAVVVTVT